METPLHGTQPAHYAAQAQEFLTAILPHMRRLVSYARQVVGWQGADAEELLHDAILTCHRRIEQRGFAGNSEDMVGYMFQQIKHEFQCQIRTSRRHPSADLPGELPDQIESMQIAAGPDPDAVHAFLHRHFAPNDVQIWEYHLQGVTIEESAFLLSMTKSSIHRHLEKIRAALRKEFRVFDEE
ncbi:hypothetical protein FY528_08980 [Hymenobacter lutimineralis]|uniref:Sigma-70 family RNA polymerase sigma factor n=1 Tax=Hymenobacter lutimineralis TaxID=2606448 RepID=A0A5D6V5X8_9BACT|nr:hypothetical protein [Hymenobacter lutimineralis]TYZ10585.1 hypothetical protein FY528_08980 [Hymenobacter lutimineralis]